MNEDQNVTQDINGKIILNIFFRHKYLIAIFIIIFVILFGIRAYLSPSVYQSNTNIMLISDDESNDGISSLVFSGGVSNSANEIALIRSNLMVSKALSKLDIGTRYFYKNKFKTHEMYKSSPFVVKVLSMEPMMFARNIYINPVDDDHFTLKLKKSGLSLKKIKKMIFSKPAPEIEYGQVFKYGEEITTSWFKIVVQRLSPMSRKEYYFTFIPNEYMGGLISSGLSVNFTSQDSSVLQITFQDTVPLRTQEVVNAVTQSYFEDEVSEKLKVTNKTIEYLDGQLEVLTKILNKSATKLKSFKQSNTDVILTNVTDTTANKITDNKVKLREIEFEESVLENLKIFIEEGKDLASITLTQSEVSNEKLLQKIAKLHEQSDKYRQSLTVYTEFHPEVIKIADDINRIKSSIKYLVGTDLTRIRKRKEFIVREISSLESSLTAIPQKERKLANLTRNYAVNEKIYSFLLEKRTEMKILSSSTLPNVRILDKASIPGSPIRPKRAFMVITGAILGFIMSSVIAFIFYFRDNTIKDIKEVEMMVDIPFYGLIPKHIKGKYTIAYEEAFRTLRTNLEFIQLEKSSKTILIASEISGEGKSTTIKNMAEMLVKLNRKVIVLDFDLRRPSLHKYFKGVNNEIGLSMLLSGQKSLQECVQKTAEGIEIISAGGRPPNPSELIMSEGTDMLLKTLAKTYDYILIDTPPYSVVTDATILMKKSDIVLFSLMAEYSKRDACKQLKQIIKGYDLTTTGIVYHGLKLKRKEQHGYGYYENS